MDLSRSDRCHAVWLDVRGHVHLMGKPGCCTHASRHVMALDVALISAAAGLILHQLSLKRSVLLLLSGATSVVPVWYQCGTRRASYPVHHQVLQGKPAQPGCLCLDGRL